MQLTTEDGTELSEPDLVQLELALSRLGLPGNGFAILSRAEQVYLQTSGSRADGYLVEYREGGERSHYSSARTDLPHQTMAAIFAAYRSGGNWKDLIEWRRGLGGNAAGGAAGGAGRRRWDAYLWMLALFFALGMLFLAGSAYLGVRTHQFLQRAVEAPGKVVSEVRRGRKSFTVKVAYADPQGRPHVLYALDGSATPSYQAGEEVTVLYDPADIADAELKTFGTLWGLAGVLLVLGLGFSGIASVHWYVAFGRKSPARAVKSA